MFKAKLIENERYYKLRSRNLWITILPIFPYYLFFFYSRIPTWVSILLLVLHGIVIFIIIKKNKEFSTIIGNKLIEIDTDEIRIKSKKGTNKEVIKLNGLDNIVLKDDYLIPQETFKEMGQELIGNTKRNFLVLYQDGKKRKLEFEIDSYYMITQLNNLIETWITKGYNIERIKTG